MTEKTQWPADKVERVRVDSLIPYAKNSRTHTDEQVAQVAASIKEWGFTNPILRDETGMVIAGHARLSAAMRLGLKEVPVMTAIGWSDTQKRAYVIADNKLAINADWDYEMLSLELGMLDDLDIDMALIGFSEGELPNLLDMKDDDAQPPDEFTEVDEDIDTEHKCPSCGYEWSGKS